MPETESETAAAPRTPARSSPSRNVVAWVLLAVLIALHLDFWRTQTPDLYFGWLPSEMAYRLGWMLLAWVYLEWFTRKVWIDEPAGEGSA